MFKNLWYRILTIFGKRQDIDENAIKDNGKYAMNYENSRDINFTSIFSNKLANYTISDCNIDLIGDDIRTEMLKDSLTRLKKKLKKIISRELGTGGVLVIPYVANNKLYFNIISQNRLLINKQYGEDIVDCTILAETITKGLIKYYRWADYVLENNTLFIRYRATNDNGIVDLTTISEWKDIKDIAISNVNKMPFMYIKSPIDNRKENDYYGVPITYGCDKQILEINETLKQILREYDIKQAFVGADSTMFSGKDALPLNGLYKKINSGEDSFWEVFDPAFRDTALYNKLMNQCALLEKQIGTSKGILTERESGNATATEIKASLRDTFNLIDDIRTGLNDGLNDFLYACEILLNYYNLAPTGKYELKTDWSYDMIEDSQQTFSQLVQGVSQGVIRKEELRQYLKPEENLEDAKKIVEEIKKENPSTKDLLGE